MGLPRRLIVYCQVLIPEICFLLCFPQNGVLSPVLCPGLTQVGVRGGRCVGGWARGQEAGSGAGSSESEGSQRGSWPHVTVQIPGPGLQVEAGRGRGKVRVCGLRLRLPGGPRAGAQPLGALQSGCQACPRKGPGNMAGRHGRPVQLGPWVALGFVSLPAPSVRPLPAPRRPAPRHQN